MKGPYYVVVAAVLVVAAVRMRRRRRSGGPQVGSARTSILRRVPLGDTGLVAAREVRERLRGRMFKVVTLVLLLVVAGAVVIPTLHSTTHHPVRVGVVGTLDPTARYEVLVAIARTGHRSSMLAEPDLAHARSQLSEGHLTAVIDGASTVLVKTPVNRGTATTTTTVASAVASALGVARAYHSAGLTVSQQAAVARARPVPVRSVTHPSGSAAARGASVVGLILIFIMLTQYNTWTLMGVLEEKASRVVEVLLSAVRPIQLLGGKLLGIGAVALLQASLVVAVALIAADAVGSDLLKGTAPMVVVASLVWLVVGYAFYSWLYAGAGAMFTRQDQVQSLAIPLSAPIIFGYVVALANSGPGAPSLLVKVLAYLPPTAPFAMPLLVAKGGTTWWEFGVSLLVSVLCTAVVARVAANVYRRAVLRSGRRLRARELIARAR